MAIILEETAFLTDIYDAADLEVNMVAFLTEIMIETSFK